MVKDKQIYTAFTLDGIVYIKTEKEGKRLKISSAEKLAYYTKSMDRNSTNTGDQSSGSEMSVDFVSRHISTTSSLLETQGNHS